MSKMHLLSRFIIFLPLVIVFVSLYFKYSTPKRSALNTITVPAITPATEKKTDLMDLMKSGSTEAKIDLNGSYTCEYNGNNKIVNVSIKSKKVYVEFTTNNLTDMALITGDCGYKWQKGKFSGVKMCGVTQLMSIYESLSSLPFLGSKALFTMLENINPSVKITPEEITAISNSCKKQEVEDSIFTIPTNISFENKGSFTSAPQQ